MKRRQSAFDLHDRVGVVTGAMGQLGGFFCEALLQANARVAALDLPSVKTSAHVHRLMEDFSDRLQSFAADVTDRSSLEKAHAAIKQQMGSSAILVNNAGIDQPPGQLNTTYLLEDIPVEAARQTLNVNLVGSFLCTQVFLPSLKQTERGSVINIGSLYASVSPDVRMYEHLDCSPPFLKPPMYGASKAAVVNLTKYLATHLGPCNVRVNALSPGGVSGNQDATFREKFCSRVPLGRMADPVDLQGPLIFLAADASRYVTGIELVVDGGFSSW